MAADVQTNAFLLGEATLMMAPFGSVPVHELTPEKHSIGMVKNVSLSQESDQVELRKGIQQVLIDSKKSNVRTTLSAEVYEFSAQNIYYSLSVAKTPMPVKRGRLKAAINGATATITVVADPLPGQATSGITAANDVPLGATILIQKPGDATDYVLPVRVTAASTVAAGDVTVTAAIPAGMDFPAGSRVWVVNEIPVGSTDEQDFFSIKVVGKLSNNERPVGIIFPKVKVMRGFQLTFDEANYTNMPFEFAPYFLSKDEITGRLSEIGTNQYGTTLI